MWVFSTQTSAHRRLVVPGGGAGGAHLGGIEAARRRRHGVELDGGVAGGRAVLVGDEVRRRPATTVVPAAARTRTAIWLAMVPDGTKRAAGLPTRAAKGLRVRSPSGPRRSRRRPPRPPPWPGAWPGWAGSRCRCADRPWTRRRCYGHRPGPGAAASLASCLPPRVPNADGRPGARGGGGSHHGGQPACTTCSSSTWWSSDPRAGGADAAGDWKVHQPYGILHGGVSALMAESAASMGGAVRSHPRPPGGRHRAQLQSPAGPGRRGPGGHRHPDPQGSHHPRLGHPCSLTTPAGTSAGPAAPWP